MAYICNTSDRYMANKQQITGILSLPSGKCSRTVSLIGLIWISDFHTH